MLQIDKVQMIEGVVVYGDDDPQAFDTFYLLPQQVRYRLDDNGNPVFKFLKYRFPVDRADGKKGGGFVIFDSEFVVSDDKLDKVTKALQGQVTAEANRRGVDSRQVKIGTITYTQGETLLHLLSEGDALV